MRTDRCTPATAQSRLARAIEFFESAEDQRRDHPERVNTWATLYVMAGIAAADVICCTALGRHHQGDNHTEAITLLKKVEPDGEVLGAALGVLLGMKTRAGYGEDPLPANEKARAPRRARQLLEAARQREPGHRRA